MNMMHRLMLASTAMMVFTLAGANPIQAHGAGVQNNSLGDRQGTRGDAYAVQAVVKLNDQPVAGVVVTFKAKHSVTATTDSNGVASINLMAGKYTVTASNDSGSATKTITVVKSTNPLIVGLTLVPKTP